MCINGTSGIKTYMNSGRKWRCVFHLYMKTMQIAHWGRKEDSLYFLFALIKSVLTNWFVSKSFLKINWPLSFLVNKNIWIDILNQILFGFSLPTHTSSVRVLICGEAAGDRYTGQLLFQWAAIKKAPNYRLTAESCFGVESARCLQFTINLITELQNTVMLR